MKKGAARKPSTAQQRRPTARERARAAMSLFRRAAQEYGDESILNPELFARRLEVIFTENDKHRRRLRQLVSARDSGEINEANFEWYDSQVAKSEKADVQWYLELFKKSAYGTESRKPGDTGEHEGTVGDEENTEDELVTLARKVPSEKRGRAIDLLKNLVEAGSETTGRATEPPRPDWIEARKQPGKVADLLAQFVRAKFADELDDGTMSTDKLYRYKSLYQAFFDHRSELPPDLRSVPTKSQSIDRQVAEGKVKPEAPRTDEQRAYDRGRTQLHRARQRGVVHHSP
jgi:hypothetical protein